MRKNKGVGVIEIKGGFQVKCWINRKMGTVLPTNWKAQSGVLGHATKVAPHRETRRNRMVTSNA